MFLVIPIGSQVDNQCPRGSRHSRNGFKHVLLLRTNYCHSTEQNAIVAWWKVVTFLTSISKALFSSAGEIWNHLR